MVARLVVQTVVMMAGHPVEYLAVMKAVKKVARSAES